MGRPPASVDHNLYRISIGVDNSFQAQVGVDLFHGSSRVGRLGVHCLGTVVRRTVIIVINLKFKKLTRRLKASANRKDEDAECDDHWE